MNAASDCTTMSRTALVIAPIAIEHIAGFHSALDAIARERIYLGQTKARPLPWAEDFVTTNIKKNHAQFVALADGKVIGWCDILPHEMPGFDHTGSLGMGLLPQWRRRGVGQTLLRTTLQKAVNNGLTRIELDVYTTNLQAIALYRKFGFVEEGVKRRARVLDGVYEDVMLMALLCGNASPADAKHPLNHCPIED